MEEARARGADDAVLLTAGGHVAEAAIWAVFWWEGDRVCAPTLSLGVLPSVARARVEELTGGIYERRVGLDEIRGTPLFVGNAVRGLIEVARFDGDKCPSHPTFADLAGRFWS
jgi:branched-subunit amino acid aminotransferase/4-amino-4-deoxychorismate lyase